MTAVAATHRRVAILGAGPTGIEAAHALACAGFDVHVYERGNVGQSVRTWGHVTLFSPWALNTSPVGRAALAEMGRSCPADTTFPTGHAYVAQYLEPLAQHPRLHGRVHTRTTVIQVGRQHVLKGELIASAARREHPFRLLLEEQNGQERLASAEIVLDTTGCYTQPNCLGDSGIPAPGERRAAQAGRILYQLPDVMGADLRRFAGRHTVVIGAGYSAATTLSSLLTIAQEEVGTRVTWLTRTLAPPYPRIAADPLPERDRLAALGNAVAAGAYADVVTYMGGVSVDEVRCDGQGKLVLRLLGHEHQSHSVLAVDQVVAQVGYHPDVSLYRELQVHQCYASEGPMQLAAALLANSGGGGDCLVQTSPGPATLTSPEPDFFILGAKSYGRGSAFLLKLGLEQIRDVLTLLGGEG